MLKLEIQMLTFLWTGTSLPNNISELVKDEEVGISVF